MEESILIEMIRNVRINTEALNDWVLSRITERIKNEVCMKALTELKKKNPYLKGGVNIDFVQLSDKEEYKKYQPEFERLVAVYFEEITEKALDSMLHPYTGPHGNFFFRLR